MRAGLSILVVAAFTWVTGPAFGADVYFTVDEVLGQFFPQQARIERQRIELTTELRTKLEKRLRYKPDCRTGSYLLFTAYDEKDEVNGYVVIDDELGQHEPITFAVKFDRDGVVQDVEIMVYREPFGSEVRYKRFRRQFFGKSAQDRMRHKREISAVSGATISSRSMSIGVRRAAVLLDEAVLKTKLETADARSEH